MHMIRYSRCICFAFVSKTDFDALPTTTNYCGIAIADPDIRRVPNSALPMLPHIWVTGSPRVRWASCRRDEPLRALDELVPCQVVAAVGIEPPERLPNLLEALAAKVLALALVVGFDLVALAERVA